VGILRSVKFGEREDQSPNAFLEAFLLPPNSKIPTGTRAGLVQVPKLELLKIFCFGEKESGTGANWSGGLGYLELDQN
jgi:hypothetical protein